MIIQETIDGLIDALDSLSDATDNIHSGLPVEAQVINSLNSSSTIDALSANMGRELKEMIETQTPVGSYTKTETDTLLDEKADKSTTYTKSEVDTSLEDKANTSDVYSKSQTYSKLEVDALVQGGGTPVDAYTKAQTDALLTTKADASTTYTKTEVDTALSSKANSADVYAKSETYSKMEVDTSLSAKADISTTYTKSETDTLLSGKADTGTTYTKAEVDTALSDKADASTTYTKTEVDTALSGKASTTDVTNKANLKLATSDNTATGEIRFGKDGDGKYGYIPEGADTVIPFSSGNPALVAEYICARITTYPTMIKHWIEYDTTKYDINGDSPSSTQKFFMKIIITSATTPSPLYDDDYITCVKNGNNFEWTPKVDCVFRQNATKPQIITANTTISKYYGLSSEYCFQFYDN